MNGKKVSTIKGQAHTSGINSGINSCRLTGRTQEAGKAPARLLTRPGHSAAGRAVRSLSPLLVLSLVLALFVLAPPAFSLEVVDARLSWVNLQVKLTQPVQASSLTEDTLYLLNNRGRLPRQIKISADGTLLTVIIKKSYLHRPFILVMTPALTDTSGQGLAPGFIKVFNVLLYPLGQGKGQWLIRVSENPRIEIEDLRRRIYTCDFSGHVSVGGRFGFSFFGLESLFWRDMEDETPPGGFRSWSRSGGQAAVSDEYLTDMHVEDVTGLCRRIPPHLGFLNVPPRITITGVSNGLVAKNNVQANIQVQDKNLFFSYNFLNFGLYQSGTLIQAEDSYWLFVFAVDKGLKFAYQFLRFAIDRTPPRIVQLTPSEDFTTNKPELVISGEVQGADKVTVNDAEVPLQNGVFQTAALALQPGPNPFLVVASDRAGNSDQRSFTATYRQDMEPPVITVKTPADGSFLNTPLVTVSGTVTDQSPIRSVRVNGSPVALQGSDFVFEGLPLQQGTNTILVEAEDEAGNKGTASVSVTLDNIVPQITVTSPQADSYTKEKEVLVQGQVKDDTAVTCLINDRPVEVASGSFSLSLQLPEGRQDLTVQATDAAGNKSAATVTVTIDMTPPAISVSSPLEDEVVPSPSVPINGKLVEANPFKVRVNSLEGRVIGQSFYLEGLPLQEGRNEVLIEAEDRAGNTAQKTMFVVLDTIAPQVTITTPPPNLISSQSGLAVRGTVADASTVEVRVNAIVAQVTGQEFAASIPLAEGLNMIKAVARDRAGNTATALTTITIDTTPPLIYCASPRDSEIFHAPDIEVKGRVVEANFQSLTLNGRDIALTGEGFASPLTLIEGPNTITLVARDRVGLQTTFALSVTLDSAAPRITSVLPVDGASDIHVRAAVEAVFSETIDAATLTAETFFISTSDGRKVAGAISTTGQKAVFTSTDPLPDGQTLFIDLTAGIKDQAANPLANPYHGSFITKDVTPPAPPTLDPLPEKTGLTALTVSGTSEPQARLEIEGGAVKSAGDADNAGRFSLAVALNANALNQLTVTALDAAGNRSLPHTVAVYQDSAAFEVVASDYAANRVTVTFSKNVDPRTVTTSSFYLISQSGREEGTVALSGEGQAVFDPARDLSSTPFLLTVTREVKDVDGNILAFEFTRMFNQTPGECFIQGEVYSDASGLPLEAALVELLSANGAALPEPRPTTITSKLGKYALSCPSGKLVIRISRDGFTVCDRVVIATPGFSSELLDARLTALEAQAASLAPEGGTLFLAGPDIRLIYPEGTVTQATPLRMTALGSQGLRERLPYGWSPLAVVDLSPSATLFNKPCSLKVKINRELAPAQRLAFARWDETSAQWTALYPPAAEWPYLEGAVERAGQYAFLLPDSAPVAPAEALPGQPLPRVTPPAFPVVDKTQLTFTPDEIFPDQRSRGLLVIEPRTPITSGVPVQAVVSESYELLSGDTASLPSYTADLLSYNYGNAGSQVDFYVSPNQEISFVSLKTGAISTDLRKYLAAETGVLIGPEGGTVTGDGGAEVVIDPGSVTNYVPVTIKAKDPASLSVPAPQGFQLLGGLELSLGGFVLKKSASLSLPLTQEVVDSLGPEPQIVAARLQKVESGIVWLFSQTAKIDALKAVSHNVLEAFLPLAGVAEGGTYVFLAPLSPLGYLKGAVSDQGQPLRDAVVQVNTLALHSFSVAGGEYGQASFLGAFEVAALNRLSRDIGRSSGTLATKGEVKTIDIAVAATGPQVMSVTPADGQTGVPPETKVEVLFSEPVKASTFNGQNFFLEHGPNKVQGVTKLSADGRRGEFIPASALPSDTLVAATLTPGIQDLASNPLAAAYTWAFRIKDNIPPQSDLSRISVLIPENGEVRIIGRPGSVEPGATIAIINLATGESVTVTGLSDGSFETRIAMAATDKLVIRVTDASGNAVELRPGPFRSEDGRSALLGAEAAEFTTPEGIGLKVEAGTFAGPVTARIEEEANFQDLAPLSSKFQRLRAFQVDLGGIIPRRPFKLSIPAPSLVTPQSRLYVGLEVSLFGEKKIMIMDTASLKEGRLETNSPPWPECVSAGTYSFLWQDPVFPMGILTGPLFYQPCAISVAELCYISGYFITSPHFFIPVGVGEEYTLKIRALDTGQVLYEGRQQGPDSASGVVEFKENITHDLEMPLLMASTLANTMSFELARTKTQSQGITVEAADSDGNGLPDKDSQVTVTGDTQAADPGGVVRIYNLTAKTNPVEVRADTEGKFTATFTASFRDKIIITLPKGNIPLNQEFNFGFSEPLLESSVTNETVCLLEVRDGSEYRVAGKAKLLESKTEVSFIPDSALREDTVYTLSLKGLSDRAGNLLPEVKSNFRTKKSSVLGFIEAKTVSDSLLVGNILVVASADEGLKLFDVSDPTNPAPLSTLYFSHARGLSKEDLPSLGLDPQGRVVLVGGGNVWNGYIKIVDISDPTNPVQVGTQKITERIGYASSYYDVGLTPPPTTLPEAYPRRVQSLSGYAFVGTVGGGFEIIDGTKIESTSSTEREIILAINQDSFSVMDLAAFQDAAAGSTYLATTAFGIYKGLYLYDVTQPAAITELSKYQTVSAPHKVELALGYPYDADNNGKIEVGEKRDLLFASIPGEEKIKVLDITDRTFRDLGEVKTPGAAGAMVVDREAGVLYTHAGEHLLLIDIRNIRRWEELGTQLLDANSDGLDDRILSQVKTRTGMCQGLSVDTNLKIAYVGNFDQGVEVVRVDPPRVEIVQDTDENGEYEPVEAVLPYGLEKNAQGNPVASARNFIYLTAFFPAAKTSTITADLWSVNFEGDLLPDWGQAKTRLENVVLTRQSDDPKSDKFNFFVSDKIQVTVDPESAYSGEKILSGEYLRAVLSPELSDVYSREGVRYVSKEELWQGMDYVKSVRAEWIDSAHPEPAQNPSTGRGELGGEVYLHSGEFALSEVDLRIPGRGLDFELRRTYESQSIFSGPLGWNWDHSYNRRLQELPDGSLVYFDGAGRREVFRAIMNEEGVVLRYEAPGGRFVETYRRLDGSVTMRDEKGVIQVFNALGRLTKIMDRNGNALEFAYDLAGKLSTAMDTMGRLIQFEYYPWIDGDVRSGRLRSLGDYSGRKVIYSYNEAGDLVSANFEGRLTQYAYTTGNDLKSGHNLAEVVDPKGQKAIENYYDSSDEVTGQKVGGVSVSINAGLSATTTDGNGHMRSYMHDSAGRAVSVTEGGYATSYSYNTDGLITSITYPMGNTASYTYDSANPGRTSQANMLQVTEMPGSGGGPTLTTTFTYDLSSNQMTSMTDPKGNRTEYMLDVAGNVVAVKSPGNIVNSYQYNQYGQLIGEANPVGAVTEYAYYPESAPGGRSATLGGRALDPATGGYLMAAVQDTGGEAIASHYEYDEQGALLLEARGEEATEYEVDRFGQVTLMKEGAQPAAGQPAMNLETAYTYDANGNVMTKASRGVTSVYSYDGRNLMTSLARTAGQETQGFSFAYDGAGNVIAATYPKGNQDTFTYDNRNLLVSKTEGGLTTVHYTYDGNGNRKTVVDGAGKTSTYVYDGHDRLLGVTDPLGNKVQATLDVNSNVTAVAGVGADGATTAVEYGYDALDRMTQQTIGTSSSVYGYDPGSRLVSTKTPNGGVWALPRTGTGRVRQMTDPAGNTDEMSWTPAGNLAGVVEREAGGRSLGRSFTRDVLGKVLKDGDTVGRDQHYTYDAEGRLDGTSDPENNQTTFTYDGFGRVKEEIRHLGTGGEAKTSFAYDANGNLVSAQDANGNTTTYEYDAKNRLTKITYPDATFETYVYDGNDRVEVQKDQNGTVVTNRYDDAGRLTRREAQKAAGIEGPAFEAFSYDGLGRLIRAESGDTVVEFTYDEQGRVVAEKQNGKTMGSGYDADGNKTSLVYPSGKTVGLTYDALDRIQTIAKEAPVAAYAYEGKAKVTGKTTGPVRMEASYDDGRRPTALSWKNAAENRELTARLMGWNKTDLKTSETRIEENSKVEQYEYDALSRLKRVTAPEKETSYEMDGVENITRIDERDKDVSKTVELQVNSRNQIASRNGIPLTYDANGNLIHYVHNYVYDWKNQLVRVEKADGSEVRFTYDGLGRRIGKEYIAGSNQAATRYVYDGWRVIEQRDGTDALKTRYTYGNGIDEAVEVEKDRDNDGVLESYYPVLNNIGSVVGIADSTGKLVEKVDYATYGAPTFIYDHTAPDVNVVRIKEGAILIRFSEPVKRDKAQQAIKIKKGTEELSGGISFEDEDRVAKFAPSSPLPQNEVLIVSISTELVDLAQNKLNQAFSGEFIYTGTDIIVYDRTSPEVLSIRLVSAVIHVEFSEEIDPATIAGAVELSSAVGRAAGEVSLSNERTMKFAPSSAITPGIEYTVRVKTSVKDLSGKSLASEMAKAFSTSGSDLIVYQKPDPNHQIASYIGNTTLFQGREYDTETGLYYFRARYLHPELGRFLQPDPKGYVDSLNPYQSFGNNPGNIMDPMGMQNIVVDVSWIMKINKWINKQIDIALLPYEYSPKPEDRLGAAITKFLFKRPETPGAIGNEAVMGLMVGVLSGSIKIPETNMFEKGLLEAQAKGPILQEGKYLIRYVRKSEFEAVQKTVTKGQNKVELGRWFTQDTITSSRAASSQMSLPNIAKDRIVGYVRVPASSFRGVAPFKGPSLVKARFGQIGFGTEIEFFRRPIVSTKGIQIYRFE